MKPSEIAVARVCGRCDSPVGGLAALDLKTGIVRCCGCGHEEENENPPLAVAASSEYIRRRFGTD